MNTNFVLYNGSKYYLQSTKKYYSRRHYGTEQERLLHRVVWVQHNGPIPEKHCVHHIDGDWKNNAIENLELVPTSEHARNHMRERFKDPKTRRKFLRSLSIAVQHAPAWHKSEEGRKWHSKNAKHIWEVFKKQESAICYECGKEYLTWNPSCAKFCSLHCRNKDATRRAKCDKRNCSICGKEYITSKYSKCKTCGDNCRSILIYKNRVKNGTWFR